MKHLNTPKNLALKVSQILEWRLNQRKLIGVENLKAGEIMKKIVNPLCETMNENPKCHLHIPNLGRASMCWTSSSKTCWEKKMKKKNPKGTPKTLMPQ